MTTRSDLHINQGATWFYTYVWRDSAGSLIDLTGYSARMSIRDRVGGTLYAYLSSGSDADGGTITLGGAGGTVTLSMTANESRNLEGAASLLSSIRYIRDRTLRLFYDLELVSAADEVTRVLEGRILVHREVTE